METAHVRGVNSTVVSSPNLFDAAARRMLDIFAASFGLLILSPIFLIIAILIKRDSPGPVFYHGPRLGKNARPFRILKFRTMFECPQSYQGPRLTAVGDDRITTFGCWLRNLKINELPQLWNVLIGDMSLVGPRPEDPELAQAWPPSLREALLSVRPGITSPAAVVFRSEETLLQSDNVMDDYLRTILPDKLRLDLNYIRNRNVLTDLDVIFMTLLYLLPRLRKSHIPEASLFWGPLARFASRYLTWFFMDTVTAYFAMGISASLWRLSSPFNIGWLKWLVIAASVGVCFSFINSLMGLTQIQWRRASSREVIPLAFSTALSTLLLLLTARLVFPGWGLPPGMLILTGMFSFLGFLFMRYRERLLTGFAAFWLSSRSLNRTVGERVLLIGAGKNSELATWFITHSEYAQVFNVVGIVDDDPRKQGLYFDGYCVLGSTRDIRSLAKKYNIGLAIFTIWNIEDEERQRILADCQAAQIRLVMFPDVLAELAASFQVSPANPPTEYATIKD